MDSRPAPLLRELKELIAREGSITFARYMEIALYHPDHGYYASRVPGHGTTYATSASLSPWFGRFVARELQRMWEALGRPDPFTVIEFGAGLGGLAAAAIPDAGPLLDVLRWRIVEQFDSVAELQRRTLGEAASRVEWIKSLDGPAITGCVLANEVLDNFPVHRFQAVGGDILEVYVGFRDGRLVEELLPCSQEEMVVPVRKHIDGLNEGDRFEICPGIGPWCRSVGRAVERGYLFTIDYGDEEPDIFQRGPNGTIATYGGARPGADPLESPGLLDITFDVDFTAVAREAEAAGFDTELLALQRYWLHSLGIADEIAGIDDGTHLAKAWGWVEDVKGLAVERAELMKLAEKEGLGGCLVYRASKGFEPPGQ
jgi:SAM-dependent MidA family methyltransferase